MERLQFPYGETPREVIEARVRAVASGFRATPDNGLANAALLLNGEGGLLTVLDALKVATGELPTYCTGHPPEIDGPADEVYNLCDGSCGNGRGWEELADAPASYTLRIDLLAALGIDEGVTK